MSTVSLESLSPASTPVTTLDHVRDLVADDDKGKWDALVPREEVELRGGKVALQGPAGYETLLRLSPWATGQLCAKLGIPAGYFRRCPAALQDEQANYWLRNLAAAPNGAGRTRASREDERADAAVGAPREDEDELAATLPWRLRAQDDRVRAVLSGHYSPLDNEDLLRTVLPLFRRQHRVDWVGLSPETFHLRIIDPTRTKEALPGDGLTIGVHIANSEVGVRCVTVDALVYRLVCSNGLIRLVRGKSHMRQRHIHLQQPRFAAALEQAVAGALATADDFVEQLRRTASVPVRDVEGAIDRIGKSWELPESTVESAKAMLLREPAHLQETLYGVINAFTASAQRLPDEHRYDLEVLAGHLAGSGLPGYVPNGLDGVRLVGGPAPTLPNGRALFGGEGTSDGLRETAQAR